MLLFWLGGASPATCKHVAATCYGLDDFTRMSTFLGSTCSTNTLCKWNAPPPQRRVSDMSLKRLTHSSLKALKRTASVRDEHDPRPPELRNPSCVKETERFRQLLVAHSAGLNKKPGWLHVLASPDDQNSIKKPSMSTKSPAHQFPGLPVSSRHSYPFKAPTHPVSLLDAQALEQRTTGQSSCKEWVALHQYTLTASNFKRIGHCSAGAGSLLNRCLIVEICLIFPLSNMAKLMRVWLCRVMSTYWLSKESLCLYAGVV